MDAMNNVPDEYHMALFENFLNQFLYFYPLLKEVIPSFNYNRFSFQNIYQTVFAVENQGTSRS